jgi:hypothetical protein
LNNSFVDIVQKIKFLGKYFLAFLDLDFMITFMPEILERQLLQIMNY